MATNLRFAWAAITAISSRGRSPVLRVLLAAAALLTATSSISPRPGSPALAAEQGSNGLMVTLSATGEELDAPSPGLTIQIRLENRTGQDLSEISVRSPAPNQTHVTTSWIGSAGANPGAVVGQDVTWSHLSLKNGDRLGPISYRFVPNDGADGARIFLHAPAISPQVTWPGSSAAQTIVAPGGLLLNGLWGEGSLRRTVLSTGLTLFTRERPDSTTVSIRLAARAGSRDENAQTRGGSHWLEHAHFLGTTHRENLDLELDAVGGESNATTGWEATDYWYTVPADSFDVALDLLADQMLYSTFPRPAFERERLVVGEELKRRDDTPSVHAFDTFINTVFKVSPLRQHPSGTIESVLSIPIDTILAYKAQRYISGNMAIAVIGNIHHDDVTTKIERAFAALPQGPRTQRPPTPEPVETDMRQVLIGSGNNVAEVRLGWPAPGDDNEADEPAMTILEDIIGTTGRRLSEEIRDKRALATSVDSEYLDFSDAGALMLSASTQPDHTDQVVGLMLDQIRRIREGDVTDADVQASIRAIGGRRAIEDESNEQQTYRSEGDVSGTLESWDETMAKLRSVTPSDVRRVANKYLDPQNYTLVVVRS